MKLPSFHTTSPTLTAIVIIVAIAVTSCIHTYPSPEGGEDPTEIAVVLNIRFNADWEILETLPTTKAMQESWPIRIITILTDSHGKQSVRKEIFSKEEISSGEITIALADNLHSGVYHLVLWADYVDTESRQPLGYDADGLPEITEILARGEESERRMCLYGSADLDLRNSAGSRDRVHQTEIILSPAVARVQIVADDYYKFLEYSRADLDNDDKYYVVVSYDSAVPRGFNIMTGSPASSTEQSGFMQPFPIITTPGLEITIASDWLLSSSELSYHTLSLTILNSAKIAVAQISDISFPTEAGKITKIKGNLLTNFITGGVIIDSAWGGEIIIELE